MADYFRNLQTWNQNTTFQKKLEQHLKYYSNDKYFATGLFHFL